MHVSCQLWFRQINDSVTRWWPALRCKWCNPASEAEEMDACNEGRCEDDVRGYDMVRRRRSDAVTYRYLASTILQSSVFHRCRPISAFSQQRRLCRLTGELADVVFSSAKLTRVCATYKNKSIYSPRMLTNAFHFSNYKVRGTSATH